MRWPSIVALLVLALADAPSAPRAADEAPLIDPDVRAAADRGTVRVLVELRAPVHDFAAIKRAQDEVERGLGGTNARVARRYATAALLAVEIDAAALARLEAMPALVARVRVNSVQRRNGAGPLR